MLDKSTPVPLYYQLKTILVQRISSGDYQVGDVVPSEVELQAEFDLSRITVRRAIDELVREGLLHKVQGKGTFVARPKVTQPLNSISSVTETMVALGMNPVDLQREWRRRVPPPEVAADLQLKPGQEATYLWRLRGSGAEPICILENYIVPDVLPELPESKEFVSLYHTFEQKYHVTIARAQEVVESVAASAAQAELLEVRRGFPLLRVYRVTFADDGRPLEASINHSRSDKYRYTVQLFGRNKNPET